MGVRGGKLRRVLPTLLAGSCAALMGAQLHAQAAPDKAQIAQGRLLFQSQVQPSCALCHALRDAGATGEIGPDLDELSPSREQIRSVLRDGSGPMPSFKELLQPEQIELMINYVFWATHPK